MSEPELNVQWEGRCCWITLNRPQVKNALNQSLVHQLTALFQDLIDHPDRVDLVILRGAGGSLCAGGDIGEMHSLVSALQRAEPESEAYEVAYQQAVLVNQSYGELLEMAENLPQVLIVIAEGAVMGGGMGLVCVSDLTLASQDVRFALPEARLGLIPAQVAPFVLKRIGLQATRRLLLCGWSPDSSEALSIGLIDQMFQDKEELADKLIRLQKSIATLAPLARTQTKKLLFHLQSGDSRSPSQSAESFVEMLTGREFIEGSAALKEKRSTSWFSRWMFENERKLLARFSGGQ